MSRTQKGIGFFLAYTALFSVIVVSGLLFLRDIFPFEHGNAAGTASSTVQVTNSAPSVSGVTLNNASSIVLTANATTTVRVNATISDNNGCPDITQGTTTILLYRSTYASSTCLTSFSYLSCYLTQAFTQSSTCTTGSINTTTSLDLYYFADATDASSSYAAQTWLATVIFRDPANATGSADSSGQELLSLSALSATTSSINYGTLTPSSTTGSQNQTVTLKNAGNASTSLNTYGTAMTSGGSSIATTSQHYATNTFTYGGTEQQLQETAQTVSGWLVQKAPLGQWANTTPLPSAIMNSSAIVWNSFLYTIGGSDYDYNPTSTVFYAPANSTSGIGQWSTNNTSLPNTISGNSAVAYNGFLYSTGGFDGVAGTSTVFYAPINPSGSLASWLTTSPLPNTISSNSAVAYNGFLYSTGGNDGVAGTSTVFYAPINPSGSIGSWALTTPLPNVASAHSAVVWNGFVYAIGGGDYNLFATSTTIYAPLSSRNTYWGLGVPAGTPSGTYNGTNAFVAVFSP